MMVVGSENQRLWKEIRMIDFQSNVPRQWQLMAMSKWLKNKRGIVQVVTGAGKTAFALMCMQKYFADNPTGQAVVIVPTLSLVDQWTLEFEEKFGLQSNQIGHLSAKQRPKVRSK